jgi:hypothetical protein
VDDFQKWLQRYYYSPSVSERMFEFLEGTSVDDVSAAYIVATQGYSDPCSDELSPVSQLPGFCKRYKRYFLIHPGPEKIALLAGCGKTAISGEIGSCQLY